METDALWRRVIEVKYENVWGGWCTKKLSSAYGVSLWRFIRSGWLNFLKLLDVGEVLEACVVWGLYPSRGFLGTLLY